jgi:hypothetical protein
MARDGFGLWETAPGDQQRIAFHNAGEICAERIPPRGWLLGTTFCRRFLSGLIGSGAVGKTTVRYAQYLAATTGRNLTGEHVHHRSRVLILCLEDDLSEVQRRIAAAMLLHRVEREEVDGWLFYATPKGLKILQADPQNGRIVGPLFAELRDLVRDLQIDIVSIDPFVKAHGVEENSNADIDEVCTMLTHLADDFDCAVDILHHARKGTAAPGDIDRARGATAAPNAGRLMRTATVMTEEEAKAFGVGEKERKSLTRLDDAKINIAAASAEAAWYRIVGVPLGNTSQLYPHGDTVPAAERWTPPDTWAGLSYDALNAALTEIDAGLESGERFSAAPAAVNRAAWPVVQRWCPDKTEKQCRDIVATWIKTRVLLEEPYDDPVQRREVKGLRLNPDPTKRPGWKSA